MQLMTNKARAYINFGRAIADCPLGCGSALQLQPGQGLYHCPECKWMGEVEWPADFDGIWEALIERPAPRNRNWFPAGHELALRAGVAHGETVADLRRETAQYMHGDGAPRTRKDDILDTAADLTKYSMTGQKAKHWDGEKLVDGAGPE